MQATRLWGSRGISLWGLSSSIGRSFTCLSDPSVHATCPTVSGPFHLSVERSRSSTTISMSETQSVSKKAPRKRGLVLNEMEVMTARMSLLETLISATEEKPLNSRQKAKRDKHIREKAQIMIKIEAQSNGQGFRQTAPAAIRPLDEPQPQMNGSPDVLSTDTMILSPKKCPTCPSGVQSWTATDRVRNEAPTGLLLSVPYRPREHIIPAYRSQVSLPVRSVKPKEKGRDPILPPSRASGGVPKPSHIYMALSATEPQLLSVPQHLLLVIDLNGTLLYRPNKHVPYHFVERPSTQQFLTYALTHFSVMIWSSAKPENVERMCNKLFSEEDRQRLLAVWGRDRLGLSVADSQRRVQVYKRLETVWKDPEIQGRHPLANEGKGWHQGNTLLVDDSVEKSRSEPYNFLEVPEFTGHKGEDPNILKDLAEYLAVLRMQTNVSSYIFRNPLIRRIPLSKREETTLTTMKNKWSPVNSSTK